MTYTTQHTTQYMTYITQYTDLHHTAYNLLPHMVLLTPHDIPLSYSQPVHSRLFLAAHLFA
jgi:hypothetical protein